jgi:hypothetical protein
MHIFMRYWGFLSISRYWKKCGQLSSVRSEIGIEKLAINWYKIEFFRITRELCSSISPLHNPPWLLKATVRFVWWMSQQWRALRALTPSCLFSIVLLIIWVIFQIVISQNKCTNGARMFPLSQWCGSSEITKYSKTSEHYFCGDVIQRLQNTNYKTCYLAKAGWLICWINIQITSLQCFAGGLEIVTNQI